MADVNQTEVQATESVAENTGATPVTEAKTAAKTFDDILREGYQAEFDRRVAKAINTAQSKFTDPRVADLEKELGVYKRRDSAARAGVSNEFIEFVDYAVTKTMTSGDDYEEKLKAYLESNPQFVGKSAEQPKQPADGWGKPQTAKESSPVIDGVEAAFRRRNPNLKY